MSSPDERVGEPAAEVVHHAERALQGLRRQRTRLDQEVAEPLSFSTFELTNCG